MSMLQSGVGPISGSVAISRKVDFGMVWVSLCEFVMTCLAFFIVIVVMIVLDPTANATVLNDMVHWRANHAAVRVASVNRSAINLAFHVSAGSALSGSVTWCDICLIICTLVWPQFRLDLHTIYAFCT